MAICRRLLCENTDNGKNICSMQKVLRKRVLRELKANFFRYLALGLLIVMAMFLVVTIVGSAEVLTRGTEQIAEETNLEDGEFSVFVPLSDEDISEITDLGVDIEEQFYLDYIMDSGENAESTLRIFKVRKSINKLYMTEGKEPQKKNEAAIEKRYAEENGIKVGDTL